VTIWSRQYQMLGSGSGLRVVRIAVEYSKLALIVLFEHDRRASMAGEIDRVSDERRIDNMDTIRT